MARRIVFVLLASLLLLFAACSKVREIGALASAAKTVVNDAAKDHPAVAAASGAVSSEDHPSYTPPADGHLSGTQIENYIKIRRRAKEFEEAGRHDIEQRTKDHEGKSPTLADVVGSAGAMDNLIGGEGKAVKELGFNEAEYEWVRIQMLEASQAALADQGLIYAQKLSAKEKADLQRSLETAPDESSREIYRGMIADNEKKLADGLATVEPQTPAMIYNKQLLAKYEDVGRPMYEALFKGTGHEAEITKALQDLKDKAAE